MAKPKMTRAQQRAFDSGQGYKLGQHGKAINFKNEENRDSFRAGYRSLDPSKYPDRGTTQKSPSKSHTAPSSTHDKVCAKLASGNMTDFDRGYAQGVYAYNDYSNVDDKKKQETKVFFGQQKSAADKGSKYAQGVMAGMSDAAKERKARSNLNTK